MGAIKMTDKQFITLKATTTHEHNTYDIIVTGREKHTDLAMYDATGDGKYFLMMDGSHPIGLIFNEDVIDFRGLTVDAILKELIDAESDSVLSRMADGVFGIES